MDDIRFTGGEGKKKLHKDTLNPANNSESSKISSKTNLKCKLRTLHGIAGKQASCTGWQMQTALQDVPTNLQVKMITSILLLKLAWIRHIELHSEIEMTT